MGHRMTCERFDEILKAKQFVSAYEMHTFVSHVNDCLVHGKMVFSDKKLKSFVVPMMIFIADASK